MKDSIIQKINIIRIKNNQAVPMQDKIIDEEILEIFINGEKSFEMVFSMIHTKALIAGFLFTQDIVREKKEIVDIFFPCGKKEIPDSCLSSGKQCHVQLNPKAIERLSEFKKGRQVKGSSGGTLLQCNCLEPTPQKHDRFFITPDQVRNLINMHFEHSKLFQDTGAVHSAGLCTPDKILCYFEDIGRHNAVDKLAGTILLDEIDTKHHVATLSCRMSLEIIGKIIKTKIPIVISNAAPTLSAMTLADQAGITVIGFARGDRFNIYTHKKRVSHPYS